MKKTFSLLLLFLSVLCFRQSVLAQNSKGIEGNGVFKTETRSVGSFTGIDVSGGFEIILTQGSKESLKLESDENILPVITSQVQNGILRISTKDVQIKNAHRMKAYVTVRDLKSIDLSGGIKLSSTNTIQGSSIKLDFSGGINASLNLQVKELVADVSGGCKINLTGHADRARMNLSGAIKLAATEFTTDYMTVQASGASNLAVNATKELTVDTSGVVSVAYKGSPKVHHSGGGKVKPI